MVFTIFPEFPMTVDKQIKSSEILSKPEPTKDERKETGKKQGIDQSVYKKGSVAENKIEDSYDSAR